MKIDLVNYITHRTPTVFFTRVTELFESAYFAAHQYSETLDEPERVRVRGQLRHYEQNRALRAAASDAGLAAAAPHTDPKGERYSVVTSQDIRFGRIGVPFNNNQPRPSKHRQAIAAVNSRLEPVNFDLFDPPMTRPSDGLGCLLVTANPPRFEPQSAPYAIIVGVPYTNLRGWHLFEPITSVLAACHAAEQLDVPDLAWAKLKKQLGEAEG